LKKWKENFYLKNKIAEFRLNDTQDVITARVLDVEPDGGITLELGNGKKVTYYTGEMSFIY